jgi:flagellin-specific chaperone FliS
MSVAQHIFSPSSALPAAAAHPTKSLGRILLEGALAHLEAAEISLGRGHNPRRDLRLAVLRIRELPATLQLPPDETIASGIGDLCRYMCRQLGTIDPTTGSGTIAAVCDLLREIRCAWLMPPRVADPARTGGSNV